MSAGSSLEARFWAKVDKQGSCWEWTAFRAKDGYGRIGMGGRHGKKALAHRVSWELINGPIAAGALLDHICHNPGCVNPGHLREVTPKQNSENMHGPNGDNRTGVRGVTWDKANKKYRAVVTHNYRAIHVGRFTTLAEAELAARTKRTELFTHNNADRITQPQP